MDDGSRRHGPAAAMDDCISGLPDELLHDILLRLDSTRAAGRTSVLSRRWRNVWTALTHLVFNGLGTDDSDTDTDDDSAKPPRPPAAEAASFLDSVDGALHSYSALNVEELDISLPSRCPAIPAGRVESWLRFASRRQVRTLCLDVPWLSDMTEPSPKEVLVLPTIDGAQDISLSLGDRWRLGIQPPAGVFAALTDLTINGAAMEGRALEALVSSQCPRLRDLSLFQVTLASESDISLRSDSLETLSFCVEIGHRHRAEIVAPKMEELSVSQFFASGARISAPKLAELIWEGNTDAFYCDIQFVDASRHLRVLEVSEISSSLMPRFDKVDELTLADVNISEGIVAYESFVNDTINLPKCGTLSVSLHRKHYHGFAPSMLHLLKKCNSIRNFTVHISYVRFPEESSSCPLPCPCRLPESCKADNITLDSLEEVKFYLNKGSPEVVEFVKQLSQCNAAILKKLVIRCYDKSLDKSFCAQVLGVCRPNIKVDFIVFDSDGRLVSLFA